MPIIKHARSVIRFVWTHPANRRRRIRAVCRAVSFQVRGRLGFRTLVKIGNVGRMWAVLHYTAASKVAYANPPDWNAMIFWRQRLKPGDLFVDVGSNVGAYALWAADLGATVIAVEPDQETAALLRENVGLNSFSITVLEVALGAEAGELTLTRGLDSNNRLIFSDDPTGRRVPVETLDSILAGRRAAGVKVDVEGAERLVMQGAEDALANARMDVIQLEWNKMSEAVLGEDRVPLATLLVQHGYSLFRVDAAGDLHPTNLDYGDDIFAVAPGVCAGSKTREILQREV